jgi:alpha-galactosidase
VNKNAILLVVAACCSIFAAQLSAQNNLALTPPMGWNSWNHFAERADDKTIRDAADAMVASGLKDAGYTYINIDDTWEDKRDVKGFIKPNSKFPDMKALADYVHSKGLKLGIYSSPAGRDWIQPEWPGKIRRTGTLE